MCVRVLIVDDHPTVRESLRYVFSAAGVEGLHEATSSDEALRAVRTRYPNVVLLDIRLRTDDGFEVLREIKAIDKSLPVLIHSLNDNPRLLHRSYHLGASGYVVKGSDKNSLINAVEKASKGTSVWTEDQIETIQKEDERTYRSQVISR